MSMLRDDLPPEDVQEQNEPLEPDDEVPAEGEPLPEEPVRVADVEADEADRVEQSIALPGDDDYPYAEEDEQG